MGLRKNLLLAQRILRIFKYVDLNTKKNVLRQILIIEKIIIFHVGRREKKLKCFAMFLIEISKREDDSNQL